MNCHISVAQITNILVLHFLLDSQILLCCCSLTEIHLITFVAEIFFFPIQCLPDQRQPEEQDDLQYTSIHFSNNQADPLYSNIRAAQPHRHMQEQKVTEYTAVRFNRGSAAKR